MEGANRGMADTMFVVSARLGEPANAVVVWSPLTFAISLMSFPEVGWLSSLITEPVSRFVRYKGHFLGSRGLLHLPSSKQSRLNTCEHTGRPLMRTRDSCVDTYFSRQMGHSSTAVSLRIGFCMLVNEIVRNCSDDSRITDAMRKLQFSTSWNTRTSGNQSSIVGIRSQTVSSVVRPQESFFAEPTK